MHSSFFGRSITHMEEKRWGGQTVQAHINLVDHVNTSFQSVNPQSSAKTHSPTSLASTACIYNTNEEK